MYVFPLSDANDTRAAFDGDFADMGDGDRGSLELHMETIDNETPGKTTGNYTVIVVGWGVAAAAISPDSGVVQRRGF